MPQIHTNGLGSCRPRTCRQGAAGYLSACNKASCAAVHAQQQAPATLAHMDTRLSPSSFGETCEQLAPAAGCHLPGRTPVQVQPGADGQGPGQGRGSSAGTPTPTHHTTQSQGFRLLQLLAVGLDTDGFTKLLRLQHYTQGTAL
jgi:hypothetical protein